MNLRTLLRTTLCLLMLFASVHSFAQVKIGDNPTTINPGSVLELESTNKGLMMPRIALTNTTTWGLLGTAAAGMHVYNTNTGITSTNAAYPTLGTKTGLYYWDGTGWVGLSAANVEQSLRVTFEGSTAGASTGLITLPINGTTFNSVQGATIGNNSIALPAGKYEVSLTVSGYFHAPQNANSVYSILHINDIPYQRLAGYSNPVNSGATYAGTAIFVLNAASTITFKHYAQLAAGNSYTIYTGPEVTNGTIKRLD